MHRLRLAAAGAIGVGVACALVVALAHPNTPEAHAAQRDTDPANACRLQPGQTHDVTLDVPGQGTRTALVRLPSHTTSRPLPLVVILHGAYGNGAFMERYSGFSQRADASGFAVVYPSAGRHFWTLAPGSGPDDVAFINRLLDELLSGGCFDARRVSAAGVSNGGGLAARLACDLSSRLAAVAMVAGGYSQIRDCHPDHPVSILEMHGTADPVVPYRGGAGDVPRWVHRWVAHDGCDRQPARSNPVSRVTQYVWPYCHAGVVVEHLAIAGGRHQWPGSKPPDPGPRISMSATDEIWRFFQDRRLASG
jgi:polyhydroxybutyrate depolymerase